MSKKKDLFKFFMTICFVTGVFFTLIYIFYTSTAFFTSDTVITDVLAHQQRVHKQFILSNWFYGNEFWLFSLTIPTYLLSFFIKNSLLLRQVSVLITAILFFAMLYIVGRKFVTKREILILITIFLTGVSYSVLDYFYAFNAYLTVIINSLILLFCYYKAFYEEKNKKLYFIASLVFTFMFSVGSLRYLPSVTAPFIFTYLFMIFIKNYDKDLKKCFWNKKTRNIIVLGFVAIITLATYYLLTNIYHFETRAPSGEFIEASSQNILSNFYAVLDSINNFFGFDNRVHPYTFMVGKTYFLDWSKNYTVYSFSGVFRFIKILACFIFVICTPITLLRKYKDNDKKINFLLIFNLSSWLIMIYLYVFSDSFFHHYHELKYFLFNMVITLMLGLYCIYKYYCVGKNLRIIFDIFIVAYIISNLFTTFVVIKEYNKEEIDRRYELTKILEKNDLKFGYGNFWTGLLTNFFSNYEIEIASVDFGSSLYNYKWYADENLYKENYHIGKTFLVFNDKEYLAYGKSYIEKFGEPSEILMTSDYYIYVYEKNVFSKSLKSGKKYKNVFVP